MGWLSALCLWTTTHLPSPIYASKSLHASGADTLSPPVVFQSLTLTFFYIYFSNKCVFVAAAAAAVIALFRAVSARTVAAEGWRPEFPPTDGKHGKEIRCL